MKRRIGLVILLSLLLGRVAARADYVTGFESASVSSDFIFGAIGNHGTDGSSINSDIIYSDGALTIQSKYLNQYGTQLLHASDDGSGLGLGIYTGTVYTALAFNYMDVSSDSSNTMVELAVALHDDATLTANNYPVYYARVESGNLRLYRQTGYNVWTTPAEEALSAVLSGNNLRLTLSAVHAGGSQVDLTAALYQNDSLLNEITYSDTSGFMAGYVGFGAGGTLDNGTLRGVDITGFSVSSVVPEPSALLLLGLGLFGLGLRRKAQRES